MDHHALVSILRDDCRVQPPRQVLFIERPAGPVLNSRLCSGYPRALTTKSSSEMNDRPSLDPAAPAMLSDDAHTLALAFALSSCRAYHPGRWAAAAPSPPLCACSTLLRFASVLTGSINPSSQSEFAQVARLFEDL